MLSKFCYIFFLLFVNSTFSQKLENFSGYLTLQSEISSSKGSEALTPVSILTIDNYKNVLEFNVKLKRFNGEFIGADTLNVFFINTEKGIYSAYKKMGIDEKPYLTESIENKKEGLSFLQKDVDFFADVQNIKIKDTILNRTKYKIATGFKKADNSELRYEAYIANTPRYFPVQISKILSKLTDGGFVEIVRIIDNANDRIITFRSSFEKKDLPKSIDKIMKAWSRN
ncbi:hypothetical protein [Flavobacterium luteolum]|uniref:hypothetical protein n=1 Tax=Flavobacterium luteolum TaxID=3003259 RepID=UPI00248E5A30|nr:hypothetical protein [Flavobacterium luteolum]